MLNTVKENYSSVWNILNKMQVFVSFITQNNFQVQQTF